MKGLASFHGGHSRFGDGRGEPAEIAAAARTRGVQPFGFTEHFTTPPMNELGHESALARRDASWLDAYVAAVRSLDGTLLGTEIEFVRGARDWTADAVSPHGFDYLVGSVHFVRYGDDDICIDCDASLVLEAVRRAGSSELLVLDYYDHVLELLSWRLVNVVGHLDVVKIFLSAADRVPTQAVRAKVDGVLEAMRDAGVSLDVNARGLVKPCAEIYPAPWILARAHRIGVPVTLGDDSHGPDDVGMNLDRAVLSLRAAGYARMAVIRAGGLLDPVALPS